MSCSWVTGGSSVRNTALSRGLPGPPSLARAQPRFHLSLCLFTPPPQLNCHSLMVFVMDGLEGLQTHQVNHGARYFTPVFTYRQYVLCHRNTTVSKHRKLEPTPLPRLVSSSLGLQAQGCDGRGPWDRTRVQCAPKESKHLRCLGILIWCLDRDACEGSSTPAWQHCSKASTQCELQTASWPNSRAQSHDNFCTSESQRGSTFTSSAY